MQNLKLHILAIITPHRLIRVDWFCSWQRVLYSWA